MPDPLFKPVGSKKRKVNKRTQRVKVAGEDFICSESEDEPAKVKGKRVETQNSKTVGVYDLWATQGMFYRVFKGLAELFGGLGFSQLL